MIWIQQLKKEKNEFFILKYILTYHDTKSYI